MPDFYDRYQQGFHQEVYNELLAMQEHVRNPHIYEDAQQVMHEIMRRVRTNIEILIPRLHTLGYLFRKGGFWENVALDKQKKLDREYPIFQPPAQETREHIAALEQLTGPLPLSLSCFFAEVGCVNFIGLFPADERLYGTILDPLCINPVEIALQIVTSLKTGNFGDLWEEDPQLILTGDRFHKYGYSGAGAYTMHLPDKAIDALILNEPHQTTFVDYLRLCMYWGGFPGFEQECHISHEQLEYLTKDLLSF